MIVPRKPNPMLVAICLDFVVNFDEDVVGDCVVVMVVVGAVVVVAVVVVVVDAVVVGFGITIRIIF